MTTTDGIIARRPSALIGMATTELLRAAVPYVRLAFQPFRSSVATVPPPTVWKSIRLEVRHRIKFRPETKAADWYDLLLN